MTSSSFPQPKLDSAAGYLRATRFEIYALGIEATAVEFDPQEYTRIKSATDKSTSPHVYFKCADAGIQVVRAYKDPQVRRTTLARALDMLIITICNSTFNVKSGDMALTKHLKELFKQHKKGSQVNQSEIHGGPEEKVPHVEWCCVPEHTDPPAYRTQVLRSALFPKNGAPTNRPQITTAIT